MDETVKALIAIAGMTLFLFSFFWRKRNKEKTKAKNPSLNHLGHKNASNKDLIEYHERENDILLRIAVADREFSAKLDTKISLLNILIEKADNKIKELKGLQTPSSASDQKNQRMELPKQELLNAKVQELKSAGLSPAEIANHLKMMEGEVNLILSILKKTHDG